MRFMRGFERAMSAVVTAGNRLGAAPAALSPPRRAVYAQQTRDAFAAVVDYTATTDAQLLVLAGGLFATVEPALDDLQFATDALRRLQAQDVTVVALDDARGDAADGHTSGIDFLAGLGLLHALRGAAGDAYALSFGGRQLGLTADPAFAPPIHARRELDALVLVTRDASVESLAHDGLSAADVVILADTAAHSFDELERVILIRPGWTAPPTFADAPRAAFTALGIDSDGRVEIEAIPILRAHAARLRITPDDLASGDPSGILRRQLAPVIGPAAALTLQFEGRFPRTQWHACRIGELVEWAAAQGTLIDVDLSAFDLARGDADRSRGTSLQVEVRRAADGLRATGTDAPIDVVDQAQALVMEALARRHIVEALE